MKKINRMVVFMLTIVSLVMFLVGCTKNNAGTEENKIEKEFEVVHSERLEGTGNVDDSIYILKHKKTGRQFILYKGYHEGSIIQID